MVEYAKKEKQLLFMGSYGVEDYYPKVSKYIEFLNEIIE